MIRKQKDGAGEMDKTRFVLFCFSSLAICLHPVPPHPIIYHLCFYTNRFHPWWPLAPGSSLLVCLCVHTWTVRVQKWECDWRKVCICGPIFGLFLLTLGKGWPEVRATHQAHSSSSFALYTITSATHVDINCIMLYICVSILWYRRVFKYNNSTCGCLIWHHLTSYSAHGIWQLQDDLRH